MKRLLVLGLLVLGLSSCKMDMEDTELCANGDQDACSRLADSLSPPPPPPPARLTREENISPLIHNKVCTVKSVNVTQEELEDLGVSSDISIETFIGREYHMTSKYSAVGGTTGTTYTNFQPSPHTGLTFHVAQKLEEGESEEIAAEKHQFKLRLPSLEGRFYMFTTFKAYEDGRIVGTVTWLLSSSGWTRVENHLDMEVTLKCE